MQRHIYNIGKHLGVVFALAFLLSWIGVSVLRAEELPPHVVQAEHAEPPTSADSALWWRAQIGIMVVEPSREAVYTLYGHAGLRVRDEVQGIDVVFNYGLFQFDDDFLYRFIKGETDYFGAPEPAADFIRGYTTRGSVVRELMLDLPPEVVQHLLPRLMWSISPEHREYRYNFFADNCSTRPLSLLWDAARAAGVPLEGGTRAMERSWRDEINEMEQPYPWLVLGTDLALGAPTDAPIDSREATFLPRNLRPYLGGVRWGNAERDSVPIILGERVYMPQEAQAAGEEIEGVMDYLTHPYAVFAMVLLLTVVVTFFYKRARPLVAIPVQILASLASLLLCYIAFISEHPSVWPNFNLLVLHPLHMFRPMLEVRGLMRWVGYYHFANFVVQLIFLAGAWLLPQKFNPCVYMLSATLLLLSLGAMQTEDIAQAQDNDDGAA